MLLTAHDDLLINHSCGSEPGVKIFSRDDSGKYTWRLTPCGLPARPLPLRNQNYRQKTNKDNNAIANNNNNNANKKQNAKQDILEDEKEKEKENENDNSLHNYGNSDVNSSIHSQCLKRVHSMDPEDIEKDTTISDMIRKKADFNLNFEGQDALSQVFDYCEANLEQSENDKLELQSSLPNHLQHKSGALPEGNNTLFFLVCCVWFCFFLLFFCFFWLSLQVFGIVSKCEIILCLMAV